MIASVSELEQRLATPDPETVALMQRLEGDIAILGAGGKMGPSLARLAVEAARQAGVSKSVYAVSRFGDARKREELEASGVRTLVCDFLDPDAVDVLPRVENVIFLAGRKFGAIGSEPQTWMSNVVVPATVARVFSPARFVVFSTGCVYPLVAPESGGSREDDPPAPVGEYANSCLGRERVFEYAARELGASVLLYRLNYALDLRYGVLHDIARTVLDERPVDLSGNAVNFIWQGDANNRALLCLERTESPAVPLNITGPDTFRVRDLAERYGKRFGKTVRFVNEEAPKQCYLADASRSIALFGPPRVTSETLIEWQAEWLMRGGPSLGKPTHYAVTDGQFLD